MDLDTLPPFVKSVLTKLDQAGNMLMEWAVSPAAWSQFLLLIAAYAIAFLVSRRIGPWINKRLVPPKNSTGLISELRGLIVSLIPLLLPVLAYAFAGLGETISRSAFDSGAIIALGKRIFLFLAIKSFSRDVLKDGFLKVLGKFVLVPIAALYALGLLEITADVLRNTIVPLGNLSFDLLWLVQFVIAASVIFWLGQWSNSRSTGFINQQNEMRPAMRQLASKAAEIIIFGAAFLVLMNVMGISLTSLAVLGGAIGVGLGFGLQKIASNFISGVILLLEGQATVGDYVELDGGEAGTIVKTTARAMILETYDGRWIVVPNEDFITTRVVNYSDQGSANRYEAEFSVSYETDINTVPNIIEKAVSMHPEVLQEPYPPDCELRSFGDSGVNFAVEFWVNGIDDGKNKYTSDVLFIIWNALKENNITIPYPHRVVELKNQLPIADNV